MTRLAVSLFVETTTTALEQASRFAGIADLVEFRVDGAREVDIDRLVGERSLPAIVTARAASEGGRFVGSEKERFALLSRALERGVEWLDVEWTAWPQFRAGRDGSRVIVSRHDFVGSPTEDDAARFFADAAASGAAMGKLASTPRSLSDVAALVEGLRRSGNPGIAVGMGRYGLVSRVLAARAGSFLVFGSDGDRVTAEGQPTAKDLARPYRVRSIGAATRLFGICGHPLSHSLSPWAHNALFETHGIDAVYVPLEGEDLDDLFALATRLGLEGLSVTIPHKEAVARRCAVLSAEAQALGAVNTALIDGERLRGENVDGEGFLDALDAALAAAGEDPVRFLQKAQSVVLGAGGAARAVTAALRRRGAAVVVASRTLGRAKRLAADFDVEASAWNEAPLATAALLVNATPVGMWPNGGVTPIDVAGLPAGAWVFDTVYNPPETRLLHEAYARGLHVVSGLDMFVAQAARQFQIFTGVRPDRRRLAQLAAVRLRAWGTEPAAPRARNVVLVGLRGSGKSTVGRVLASRLGRPFVDLDQEIVREAGATIAQIFAREGEGRFRELERHQLTLALERDGLVVAAGGGVVLDARNRKLLRDRSDAVYLEAPGDVLFDRMARTPASEAGRPSLTGLPLREEIEALERARAPHYREAARLTVDAGNGEPGTVAERIVRALASLEPRPAIAP